MLDDCTDGTHFSLRIRLTLIDNINTNNIVPSKKNNIIDHLCHFIIDLKLSCSPLWFGHDLRVLHEFLYVWACMRWMSQLMSTSRESEVHFICSYLPANAMGCCQHVIGRNHRRSAMEMSIINQSGNPWILLRPQDEKYYCIDGVLFVSNWILTFIPVGRPPTIRISLFV